MLLSDLEVQTAYIWDIWWDQQIMVRSIKL